MMFSEATAIERNVQQAKWVRCATIKSTLGPKSVFCGPMSFSRCFSGEGQK
jgi:hypothetical protein